MSKQLAMLFEKDGESAAFVGRVTDTTYDTEEEEVIIHIKKLTSYATLKVALDNAGVKDINNALLQSAADANLESSYLRRRLSNANEANDSLRTRISIMKRQIEILERKLQNVSTYP
jgi:hypothetical protein